MAKGIERPSSLEAGKSHSEGRLPGVHAQHDGRRRGIVVAKRRHGGHGELKALGGVNAHDAYGVDTLHSECRKRLSYCELPLEAKVLKERLRITWVLDLELLRDSGQTG